MAERSILVVDDEAAVTLALESYFQSKGYQVSRAFYGDQAIERIGKERPCVAILDLQMPGVDGIAVLRRIQESYPEVRTLVITGYGDRYREDLERLKPDKVLLKPISLEEMTRSVEDLLGKKGSSSIPKGLKAAQRIRLLFVGGMEEFYSRALKPHFEGKDRLISYETMLAARPEEAFRLLEGFRPHLALIDGARLPIGVDAGKLAADLERAPCRPVAVIIHAFQGPPGGGPISEDQLEKLEGSIQQVAKSHRLLPTEHGG